MQTKQEILLACKVEGTIIKLPSVQLERKLYQEVAKALELIGGKWKGGKVAGFEFSEDPSELLAQIANGDSRNLKKEFQFFETPAEVADWLVSLADVKPSHYICEPSAGQGAIIKAIQRVLPQKAVAYCELMPLNKSFIERIPKVVELSADFFDWDKANCFDRIIANPPFAKNQDIDHVRKMYECLKPGGRLVSIMSKHWQHSNNRKETDFRKWLVSVKAKTHTIPAGAFKQSGTMIETITVVISKEQPSVAAHTIHVKQRAQSIPLVCLAALRLEVYPPNARALVMQYFISGGKINPDALQALFGNKRGKSIEGERKARFTWCSKADGKTIDQIAHWLWEQNLDLDSDFNIESDEFRDAVNDVILSYNSTVQMAKDLMTQYNPTQQISEEEEEEEASVQSQCSVAQEPVIASAAKQPVSIPIPVPVPKAKPTQSPIVNPQSSNSKSSKPVPAGNLKPETLNLKLIKYSERSVALIGDCRPLKDQLAALWGKYCPNLHVEGQTVKGWIFSAKREPQLKQLIAS